MPPEDVLSKARRYLGEGRLTITAVNAAEIRAVCRGDGRHHHLGYNYIDGWHCDCPARVTCCHLVALRHVTNTRQTGT